MTAATTAVERVRRWVGGDLDCYGTGTEAADKFTTDLRTILSDHARLSAALGEARGALEPFAEAAFVWTQARSCFVTTGPTEAERRFSEGEGDDHADEIAAEHLARTSRAAIFKARDALNRARTALQQQEARDGRE